MRLISSLLLVLVLTACSNNEVVVVEEEPIVEETIEEKVYEAPELFLNHEDYGYQETSSSLQDMGTCYEIFPISFADSNGDGDGDINGIRENLDYLIELGIDCIWLTPVTTSNSYHKYDVIDYYNIDPTFGTNDDFKMLLEEAETAGIKVLMDLVVNHTSKDHPWYDEHPEYYRFVEYNHPDYNMTKYWHSSFNNMRYFAYFWDQMPELNLDNPVVREEIMQIAEYWIEMGVDGYRLDAALHFFDSYEYPKGTKVQEQNILFLKELNARVKAMDPNFILLSEVWTGAETVAKYYQGVDTSFNFDLGENILAVVNSESDDSNVDLIETLLETREAISTSRPDFVDSTFLTNHDQDRVMSVLENEDKAKLSANILFTLPGLKWIYYGEELGMTGEGPHEDIRQPMIWDNEYTTDGIGSYLLSGYNLSLTPKNDLFEHYKYLIELNEEEVFKNGELLEVNKTQRHFLAYLRTNEDITYLVVHNLRALEKELMLDVSFEVVDEFGYEHQIGETIMMAPYSTIILEVDTTDVTLTY